MKRGSIEFHYIIAGILAILVIIVMVFIIRSNLAKESDIAHDQINRVGTDADDDGVTNFLDRCCCTPPGHRVSLDGCSTEGEDPSISCNAQEENGCPT